MIKNIVFDIGNVILNFNCKEVLNKYTNNIDDQEFIMKNIINSPEWLEHGLIDPTGVIISEILNSASVAGLLLTTTASIISIPDEKDIAAQNQQLAMQM